jgi:hypothetical protein
LTSRIERCGWLFYRVAARATRKSIKTEAFKNLSPVAATSSIAPVAQIHRESRNTASDMESGDHRWLTAVDRS